MNNRGMPIIGLGARSAEHADTPMAGICHARTFRSPTSQPVWSVHLL